jgi:GT2 family glycosyltransferase
MPDISIIVVNYNVKYFLEQVLVSVIKALQGIEGEIFVVDNNSSDGSGEMVQVRFPEVRLIQNKTNLGFAKANNQAIKLAKGRYVLLLNPDTVVEEDTFSKIIAYMDSHPEAGGLGVKMLDGKGNFLPESKRSLPTPKVAFFKAFGLSAIFPQSKVFGKYHLSYLDENEIHEVDVLSGAFMLVRREILEQTNGLDEDYFMYGEDIDLSYRITLAGYKNIYFPETRIIHYKGESTKKGSLNYVKMFYNAMVIFSDKHFGKPKARFFSVIITLAVFLKAVLHLFGSFVRNAYLIVLDAILIWGGIYLIKNFWATNIKSSPDYYPLEFILIVVPAYIAIWLISMFFSGGYDRPYKVSKAVRGIFFGTVVILAVYGFIGEQYRFSRAIIILGAAWVIVEIMLTRMLIHFLKNKRWNLEGETHKNSVIVGEINEAKRVLTLLKQSSADSDFIGFVTPNALQNEAVQNQVLGDIDELEDIVDLFQIDEIIFCAKNISTQRIIRSISVVGNKHEFKIVPEAGLGIIGSNSKDSAGDLYAIDVNFSIDTSMMRRNKRVLDVAISLVLLMTLPVSMFLVNRNAGLLKNIFTVLTGLKSWVGYCETPEGKNGHYLPKIKNGVLCPMDSLKHRSKTDHAKMIGQVNLLYAKNYDTSRDIEIIRKGFRGLGNT